MHNSILFSILQPQDRQSTKDVLFTIAVIEEGKFSFFKFRFSRHILYSILRWIHNLASYFARFIYRVTIDA